MTTDRKHLLQVFLLACLMICPLAGAFENTEVLKGVVVFDNLSSDTQEMYRSYGYKLRQNKIPSRAPHILIYYGCSPAGLPELAQPIMICDNPGRHLIKNYAVLIPEPSPSDQINLAQAVLPQDAHVAVIYSRHTQLQYDILTEQKPQTLELNGYKNHGYFKFSDHLKSIIEQSDYILALPDETIFNQFTMRALILNTYRANKPVFGPSKSFVTSGSLASLCANEYGVALSAIELANHMNTKTYKPGIYFPEHLVIQTNNFVASSFSINLPEPEILLSKVIQMRDQEAEYE